MPAQSLSPKYIISTLFRTAQPTPVNCLILDITLTFHYLPFVSLASCPTLFLPPSRRSRHSLSFIPRRPPPPSSDNPHRLLDKGGTDTPRFNNFKIVPTWASCEQQERFRTGRSNDTRSSSISAPIPLFSLKIDWACFLPCHVNHFFTLFLIGTPAPVKPAFAMCSPRLSLCTSNHLIHASGPFLGWRQSFNLFSIWSTALCRTKLLHVLSSTYIGSVNKDKRSLLTKGSEVGLLKPLKRVDVVLTLQEHWDQYG